MAASPRNRILAFCGLLAVIGPIGALRAFPVFVPYLKQHRQFIKEVRARMRGARFLGEAGVTLQLHENDCGPAALAMVLRVHGIERSLSDLSAELHLQPAGTSMLELRLVSAKLGVPARAWLMGSADLAQAPLPAIAFINRDHFVVVRRHLAPDSLEVDDPALGKLRWPLRSFGKAWSGETLIFDPAWTP